MGRPSKYAHIDKEALKRTRISHGAMLYRCTDPRAHNYRNYGGRGITVCERWKKFEQFLADMGPRPAETTLDRIDSAGNYEPTNCRWATRDVQNMNRRHLLPIEFRGEKLPKAQWAERLGIAEMTFHRRLKSGMPMEAIAAGETAAAFFAKTMAAAVSILDRVASAAPTADGSVTIDAECASAVRIAAASLRTVMEAA